MTPILFDKTETTFVSNGIGRLVDAISCTVTEERNGIYECELEYPITGKWYHEMITNGGIIGVIHDDNHDIQPFDIYQSTAPIDGIVTFYAHHISYRLNNIILQPFTATSASDAISKISTNSVNTNPFTFSTDKTVNASFKLNCPASVRSILFGEQGSLLDTYGTAEFKFDKFSVSMLLHRGTDTGVTVRYGKNMTELERTLDDSGTYNAIAPYWTDGTNFVYPDNIIVQPTTPISPMIPAVIDFSDQFEQQPSKSELINFTTDYLDSKQPWKTDENIRLNFIAMWQTDEYADVASIQRVGLCDTVSVYFTDLGVVAEKMEVVRVVFDVLSERFNELELGSVSKSYVAIDNGNVYSTSYQTESINRLGNSLASVISGKKVSIIGDSISTFDQDGYKISGYSMYYPNVNIPDVATVSDTWWKKVLDASGCVLEVNASYSGSRVTNTDAGKPDFYARCSSAILGNPDSIIVALGTNDSANSVAFGNFDFTTAYTSLSEATFRTAYIKGIKALQNLYPNAQIVCVCLNMGQSYVSSIARIATYLGCHYIACPSYEKGYTTHPNAHGMRQIASAVLAMQRFDGTYKYDVVPNVWLENGDLFINRNDIRRGVAPSSNIDGQMITFRDRDNNQVAGIRYHERTDGETRLNVSVNGVDDNSNVVTNYMRLDVQAHGAPAVTLGYPSAWRKALGIGDANGALPIPVSQGGTGATTENGALTALSGLAEVVCESSAVANASYNTVISFNAALRVVVVVTSSASASRALFLVWCSNSPSNPVVTEIYKGSNISYSVSAGKLTIQTSTNTNVYSDVLLLNSKYTSNVTISHVAK